MGYKIVVVIAVLCGVLNSEALHMGNSKIGKRTLEGVPLFRRDYQQLCRMAIQLCQGPSEDESAKPNYFRREWNKWR